LVKVAALLTLWHSSLVSKALDMADVVDQQLFAEQHPLCLSALPDQAAVTQGQVVE
jgi:hypothetical protein